MSLKQYQKPGILLAVFALFVTVVMQLQHLLWSTARVKNDSPHLLSMVSLRVGDASVFIGDLAPGASRFLRLPAAGEATLSVEFFARGEGYSACAEYVESDMYHVRINVPSSLEIVCTAELGLFKRIMLFELF